MSAVAETSIDAAAGDRLARRNAMILAVAQALAGGNNVVLIATGAIVGAMLAPDRSLATVPVIDLRARHVDGHAADAAGSPATTAGGRRSSSAPRSAC